MKAKNAEYFKLLSVESKSDKSGKEENLKDMT